MRFNCKISGLITVFIFCLAIPARADDNLLVIVRNMLQQGYPVSYIQSYLQPFATAFGSTVISGLNHRAFAKTFPHGDIGVKAIKLKIPSESMYFTYEGSRVPTVFGPSTSDSLVTPGTGLNEFVLPMYQLNFGMFSGFEVLLRVNNYTFSEIGDMDFFGIGVKYGLSDLITSPVFPISMSVQVIYHTFGISDWLNSGTFAMNLQVSSELQFIPFTILGAVGYESTSLKLSSDKIPGIGDDAIGDVSIAGVNKLRGTAGIGVNIWMINLYAEYNFGVYNSAAAGAMITF